MVWLLQQHGLLLVNMCNLNIQIYRTFNSYNERGRLAPEVLVGLPILCF